MSGHTPGPWRLTVDSVQMNVRGSDETPICEMWLVGSQTLANARLVAAAPELLAALEAVMFSHGADLANAFDKARAAIAKATGASQ